MRDPYRIPNNIIIALKSLNGFAWFFRYLEHYETKATMLFLDWEPVTITLLEIA